MARIYLCIDLKSFYASVECVERNLEPLTTNLVVADKGRTEKTICLAVTPSLKAYGIPGRARLFEVMQTVKNINLARRRTAPRHIFTEKSCDVNRLNADPSLEFDYIVATPRMAHYIEYSTKIYEIYLDYVSSDDILVYSIDEVFMDITDYLAASGKTPENFARTIVRDVLKRTGITATAGIGANMYLAKIAMDITAKKMQPDKYGVRVAYLDEMTYRKQLWEHKPLTDFWRVGRGYAKKLEENRMLTMGDIAWESTTQYGRAKLKKLFGINAKMLIDHAWGYEPCTIARVKAYTPENKSISTGQVLHCPYDFDKARVIVWEMLELLSLDLVEKRLVTNQIVLTVGYDRENLTDSNINRKYGGEITSDMYGRKIPKHAHGTANIDRFTSFEGNTGPYILYTIVRIKSILNRYVQEGGDLSAGKILPAVNDSEKNLMLQLSGFAAMVENAFEEKAPHKICAYIYEVSNAFNSFYHETKILSEEDQAQKESFLQLLQLTRRVLETSIDLLGFSAPDRM